MVWYVRLYLILIYYCCFIFFFFFKQKTAYEMRISDWSSDVCSSDLLETKECSDVSERQKRTCDWIDQRHRPCLCARIGGRRCEHHHQWLWRCRCDRKGARRTGGRFRGNGPLFGRRYEQGGPDRHDDSRA